MRRRDFLHSTLALSALATPDLAAPTCGARPSRPDPSTTLLSRDRHARWQKLQYRPPQRLAPEFLRSLTYDQYQAIRFRHDHALWAQTEGAFRLEFFHCGRGFKEPVELHEIVDGAAREIRYRPDMFEFADSGVDPQTAAGGSGVRGLSRAHLDELARGRRSVSRRQLLPRPGQRLAAVRSLRARARHRHRERHRGVSALRRLLVRAAGRPIRARSCSTACSIRRAPPAPIVSR